ncbi:hypothetical protein Metho_1243 [Methanomethylovorans hollandica DSM 15978]|uniref:Uncharacterized protein n=1 Tax=Methanomethylovorans hollandica (strain DSM 15978 / NBRC 107637 / DMS1) TaxID=867904 RepID=L0KZE9_METHD|nr:hypothetical protein [Methanomethylovorans hollandica]AGB49473.1 hypothetical protein Metho_1243 [Methanomethylovorans hollandica DSM 15978]
MMIEVSNVGHSVWPDNSYIEKRVSRMGSRYVWSVHYTDCLGLHVETGAEASKFRAELAAKRTARILIPKDWRE